MTIKSHDQEEMNAIVFPILNGNQQPLRKVVSDVTDKMGKDLEAISQNDVEDNSHESLNEDGISTLQAECECCGLKEEYTKHYISRIRNAYSGKWVCGLCSEAVKERLERGKSMANMEEAVSTHINFLREFNSTTRLDPKLSLASAMKAIAKKSGEHRRRSLDTTRTSSKINRSSSCVPTFDFSIEY